MRVLNELLRRMEDDAARAGELVAVREQTADKLNEIPAATEPKESIARASK
eukprot:CAMPEP_0185750060 /NCGR_PEP_ID=MMETSP1174-20130828/8790_1 /TAXON_ID=35687 /ORGANISM="Dictyocha speculum, Strain CCMP1381" /LENGTH=50 /DNA_ID=CAMNT_0028426449 /DNA_START=94 /DNA_END=243 /DNA_ORIENTATION=-